MKIKIEKIREKDVKKAYEFCIGIWDEMGWDKRLAEGLRNLKKYFDGNREVFFLGKKGKDIIASIGLQDLSKDKGLMMRFYVAEDFRGKGVAALMLENVKEFAKSKGYKDIVLDVFKTNLRAKKFYKKHGFKAFHPDPKKYDKWKDAQHPDLFDFKILKLV
jgi:ribosomal protein S18 acetylase RimI-like enzyme